MSEQHFYDNAFLLLSYSKDSEQKVASTLHRGFIGVDKDFFEGLVETTILGNGGFGRVYSCRDPHTGIKYAVKHIFGKFTQYLDHAKHLLSYMTERNANIRAMESPLVVKFFYSLQLKGSGDLFLFFEFCVGDLFNYIQGIKCSHLDKVATKIYQGKPDLIPAIYKGREPLLETGLLYIFEVFSGLDFLVRCNIIHQDIKPENIMVSETMHLKIGDFGLAYRTRTIHKRTNIALVAASEMRARDYQNYHLFRQGTKDYQDLEIQLLHLQVEDGPGLMKVIKDRITFDSPGITFDPEVVAPSFLVDTWAAGITAVKLLFCGLMPLSPYHLPVTILKDVPRESKSLFIIHMVGRSRIYDRYLNRGLVLAGGNDLAPLMSFLASIFRPRLTRSMEYRKAKKVYHFSRLVTMYYIDMDKVEELGPFAARNFSRSTIHLRQVPEVARKVMGESKTEYKKFTQLLDEIEVDRSAGSCPSSVVVLNPGVTINFFT